MTWRRPLASILAFAASALLGTELPACSSPAPAEVVVVPDAGPQPDDGPVPDGSAVVLSRDLALADVAILFPLAADAQEASVGYVRASDVGSRGVLLPEALDPGIGESGLGTVPGDDRSGLDTVSGYESLRVVALRIDPCFASLAPPASGDGCKSQLRLVFQSVSPAGTQFADSAAHAFYSLTRDELASLTKSLVAIREAEAQGDGTGPLAPNAIMAREGLAGPMARGVRAIIRAYAGEANLTRVTHFSIAPSGFSWIFAGVDVSDASSATKTPMNIPTIGVTSQEFQGFDTDQAINGLASPETSSSDDFFPLVQGAAREQLTSAQRQSAFDALLRVENPADNSPDTMDCVSCHTSTQTSRQVALPLYNLAASGNPDAFLPASRVPTSDMAPTVDETQVNLHAFSYARDQPGISQRTVNEAAAVVAYLAANVP